MKNFLAERFPVLWNTGLFLVLPLVFLAHISFFCWGYNSLDITIAKGFWWQNIFYHYSKFHFYVNLGITLLLITIWLFFLLRNEHFKAFYLLSKRRFLAEFLIYWGVILVSGILLVSFFYGVKIEVDIFKQEHLEYLEKIGKQDSEIRKAKIPPASNAFCPSVAGLIAANYVYTTLLKNIKILTVEKPI